MKQKTIRKEVRATGIGLHSGKLVQMSLKPAPANSGIRFVRTDLDRQEILADITNVDFSKLMLATTLKSGDAIVQTIEHLLSALNAAGIDNIFVELDAPEVPIMDGSAAPFVYLIEEAGIKTLNENKKVLTVTKPFHFEKDGKTVSIYPSETFKISYEIVFDHPLIQCQRKTVEVSERSFEDEIGQARTFGFLKDAQILKKMGLIQGGSIDNAIILDGDQMLNASLRQEDEFVSHKILDCIGDLAVSGAYIKGHVVASKAGHEMHALFLKALLESDCITFEQTSSLAGSTAQAELIMA